MVKINNKLEEQKLQMETSGSTANLVNDILQQVNSKDSSTKINIDTASANQETTIPADFYQVITHEETQNIQLLKTSSLRETYTISQAQTNSNNVQKQKQGNTELDGYIVSFIDKIKKQKAKMSNAIANMAEIPLNMLNSLFNNSGKSESIKTDTSTEDNV